MTRLGTWIFAGFTGLTLISFEAGASPVVETPPATTPVCTPVSRASKDSPAIRASRADTVRLRDAWLALGLEATETRMRVSGAIAAHETGFAQAWGSAGVGSNNWGAIQSVTPSCPGSMVDGKCRAPGSCPTGTFLSSDGDTGGRYWMCYRSYRSEDEGARRFVAALVQRHACRDRKLDQSVLEAIDTGDATQVSKALYATCYFTTHKGAADPEARIAEYAKTIEKHWTSVDACWLKQALAVRSKPETKK